MIGPHIVRTPPSPNFVRTPPSPKCDFCSARPVKWDYPCRDFSQEGVAPTGQRYVFNRRSESWAACDACHRLIQAGDREQLARRSVTRLHRLFPDRLQLRLPGVRAVHDTFWANREANPVRIR